MINRVEGRAETCGGHESPEPQHETGMRLAGAVAPLCQVVQIRAAPISLVTARSKNADQRAPSPYDAMTRSDSHTASASAWLLGRRDLR